MQDTAFGALAPRLIGVADISPIIGGQALTFDQLLITQKGDDTRIEIDLDENGVADALPNSWQVRQPPI